MKVATIQRTYLVYFEDNGEDDLHTQAHDAFITGSLKPPVTLDVTVLEVTDEEVE